MDFSSKIAKNQIIHQHSTLNKLIFVPKEEFQEGFTITLVDLETNSPKTLNAIAEY